MAEQLCRLSTAEKIRERNDCESVRLSCTAICLRYNNEVGCILQLNITIVVILEVDFVVVYEHLLLSQDL